MNDLVPAIGKVVKEGTANHYAYVYYPPTDSERTNIGDPTYEGEIINMYAVWESRHFYVYLHDAINDPITTDALRKIRNMIGYGYTYGFSEYLTGVEKQVGTVSDVEYVFSGWSTSEVELGDYDESIDPSSSNAVKNSAIAEALAGKVDKTVNTGVACQQYQYDLEDGLPTDARLNMSQLQMS